MPRVVVGEPRYTCLALRNERLIMRVAAFTNYPGVFPVVPRSDVSASITDRLLGLLGRPRITSSEGRPRSSRSDLGNINGECANPNGDAEVVLVNSVRFCSGGVVRFIVAGVFINESRSCE